MKKHTLLLALLFTGLHVIYAQDAIFKGTVKDAKTGETLIGVNVVNQDKTGTTTDINGQYTLKLPAGKHKITFSFVGYGNLVKDIELKGGEEITFNTDLKIDAKQLDLVVVTGSIYEKKISEEVVSIEVVKPYLVQNTNSTSLANAVEKVPGVNVIDGQATIRGGAGYAYGTGTRVQVLVDEMPLITADLSEVRWNYVPIENVEQIEVIKGASSSLYGSGALNGVINIRTGYAYDEPRTEFSLYQGIYSNPKRDELRWWKKFSNPFFTGAFLSHRQKFGNLHLVVGGNVNAVKSYLENGDDQQARLNVKLKYDDKKVKGLSYGIHANGMFQQFGRIFMWMNADTGAYKAYPGTQSDDFYSYFNVDPFVNYVKENGASHRIRTRYYNVVRWGQRKKENKDASTNSYYFNYQYQKPFKSIDMVLTAGLVYTYSHSFGNLYTQSFSEKAQAKIQLGATYLQIEKKFWKKLQLLAGVRYEIQGLYQRKDSVLIENTRPLFRAGLNYQITESTFLRASFGEGYRIPSIGERFIDVDITSGIHLFKNPDLQPESGWTAEIGLKQGFKLGKWLGYADLALFWQEYKEMVEFLFVVKDNTFGFQSQNVSRARIAGIEFSMIGNGAIGKVPLRLLAGYTFNYPGDLSSDSTQKKLDVYLQNFFQSFGNVDSLNNQGSILKYRLRNVARADIECDLGRFTPGLSITYNSFIDRIDAVFIVVIPGVDEYRKLNNKGVVTLDARLAYRITPSSTVNLVVKNLTNEEYSLRPGMMEAPRSFTLQYRLKI